MKIDGGCYCGEIRFEAEVDPAAVVICHCTDCQQMSGSAFRTIVVVTKENLTITAGAPKVFHKTAESGNRRLQTFCGACGSPFYSCDADQDPPDSYAVRLGIVRQRAALTPRRQIWHRSAQAWLEDMSEMPALEAGWGSAPVSPNPSAD